MGENALVRLDGAERILAEVEDIEPVMEIHSLAKAAVKYAKARKMGLKEANKAAMIRELAERKAGQIFKRLERGQPNPDGLNQFSEVPPNVGGNLSEYQQVMSEVGTNDSEVSRWQRKDVPEEDFRAYMVELDENGKEITGAAMLQFAVRYYGDPEPAETPPLPDGTYRCIVIDPPWPVQKIERVRRPLQGTLLDYPVMSLDDIAAMPVSDVADDEAHLYLWVTQKYLPVGLDMLDRWGFRYQCLLTWIKPTGITPYSWMYNTEHVIFAHRGGLRLLRLGMKLSFEAPVEGHSVKPQIFYDIVAQASPGPRIDMFARQERAGFDVWGNEV